MRKWDIGNVTLVEEDAGELTLYVSDDTIHGGLQELALLPEELERIQAVIAEYEKVHKM